jgi:hypothetical protein
MVFFVILTILENFSSNVFWNVNKMEIKYYIIDHWRIKQDCEFVIV